MKKLDWLHWVLIGVVVVLVGWMWVGPYRYAKSVKASLSEGLKTRTEHGQGRKTGLNSER